MCALSFLLALMLAYFIRPWFARVLDTQMDFSEAITVVNSLKVLGFIVVLGGLSGIIPAAMVTRFNPIEVVRGSFRRQSKMVYGKMLIVFQYFITILLLGSVIVMLRQTYYMKTSDLGFDKNNIVLLSNTLPPERVAGFKDVLLNIAGVEKVSMAFSTPFDGGKGGVIEINGQAIDISILMGDSLYMDLMEFEILWRTGNISPDAVWLSETLFRRMQLPQDATEFQSKGEDPVYIAGVVKDFKGDVLHDMAASMIMRSKKDPWRILVRVSGNDPVGVMKKINDAYRDYSGDDTFTCEFSDFRAASAYDREDRLIEMTGVLALLAILISSLGMLAMSTYFIRQRAQEVAVRKVFGSTERQIIGRLVMSFLKLVIIAFVLAVPVIWYLMNQWLEQYAYRIEISWLTFILAGLVALAVAGATVLWQSYRAATANPIKAMYK